MKKTSIIITTLLLLAMSLCIHAQGQFNKPLKSQKQGANLAFSDYTLGFVFGCPWSYMPKSDLHDVTYQGNIGYSAGMVAERYFNRFSLSLEGLFSQKGTKMYYEMPYQITLNNDGVYHREFYFGYNLISVRLPVSYYLKGTFKDDKVIPYFFVGPQIDIPLPFNASFKDGKFSVDTTTYSTNITTFGNSHSEVKELVSMGLNASVLAGMGLMARIPTEGSAIIIKFNVALNYGLINLAWESNTDDTFFDQLGMFLTGDKCIRAHDLEANLSVVFPIKRRLRDACYYLQR